VAVGLVAFVCYWHTLLPGLDFGDTASFQTGVESFTLTPRQAYPLYYALGHVVAWADPGEPAHAMNLASAIYGALAVGAAVLVAADIAGASAGLIAGLLLAFSYTFWTQAVIAEVYTLHLLLVGLCLLALLAWARAPTLARLAAFYAIYALGFGNHLSMVLLLPGFMVFILMVRPRGAADPLKPKAIAMALGLALLGALQYAWNFAGLWRSDPPPSGWLDAFSRFWFDVTKSDWRQTLVMGVSENGLQNRPAMYWFDLHQQFGTFGVLLAVAGVLVLATRRRRVGALFALVYLTNLVFAWTYNVGDVHVFFLPSHYMLALCAGIGGAQAAHLLHARASASSHPPFRRPRQIGVTVACLLYVAWRGYDTYPAVDRSWDHRPEQVLAAFVTPLDGIFGMDMNWQVQNGVEYYMRRHRGGVPWFTFDQLAWLNEPTAMAHFQRFSDVNARAGHPIVLTPDFAQKLRALGYRGVLGRVEGPRAEPRQDRAFADQVSDLAPGTTYALGILLPYREYPLDRDELAQAWVKLTGGKAPLPFMNNYTVVIGAVGSAPLLVETGPHPFRARATMGSTHLDVRMESWLPTDTIRRAGFGHVIANRRHVLSLDRGLSFVALGAAEEPLVVVYRGGLFAPLMRVTPMPDPLRRAMVGSL
jgi:Protein of unknown function (DUF2723)